MKNNSTIALCLFCIFGLHLALSGNTLVLAQAIDGKVQPVFDEQFDHWPLETNSKGRVIINRGVNRFAPMKSFLDRLANKKNVAVFAEPNDALAIELQAAQKNRPSPDRKPSIARLTEALKESDTVYISSTSFSADQLGSLKPDLVSFVARGGNLIFDAELGHLLGTSDLTDGKTEYFNLLPDCLIDCQFDGGQDSRSQMIARVSKKQRTVGVCIAPNTCTVLAGRQMFSYGPGSTTLVLPASKTAPVAIQQVGFDRKSEQISRIDLTQWRRRAIDRSLAPFPSANPEIPFIENGTLFIVGGGGTPKGLMTEMVELAGGRDQAKLVYVPCSESTAIGQRQGTVEMWKRMGVKQATFIHTKDRNKANTDESFLQPLNDATMLWFGGGRQWNFADSYYGTKAHQLMKQVLHRGGVIGGSSAGASIQGRFLARATPIGNSNILAPGYERGGLGFLSGVAIDQHFSQRRRQKDMTQLIKKYPQLLGIGIDESTAIKVQKSMATVIGRGRVYFYDANRSREKGQPDYEALAAGGVYDLANRKVVKAAQ